MRLYPITVDDREKKPPSSQQVAELQARGVSASLGHLEFGDYRWLVEDDEGNFFAVVVERKTVADLLASVQDGRLTRFIENSTGVGVRCLLVEGDISRSGEAQWTADRIDNLLADAGSLGVIVLRCGAGEAANRIASFWRHTGEKAHHTLVQVLRPLVTGYYFDSDVKDAVRALMSLPGWGEAKSNAAISEFRSVAAVLDRVRARDYKAFAKVGGIGKGLVDKAADFLEKEVK